MTTATTTTGRQALRSEIAMSWDGGDPWGSALSVMFGLGSVLTVYGGEVPAEADYTPGLGVTAELSEYPDSVFAEFVDEGYVALADLTYWMRVLSRYADLVPEDRRY